MATYLRVGRPEISTTLFGPIVEKISACLDDVDVITLPELQYRLCEVGPPKSRVDPVALRTAVGLYARQGGVRPAFDERLTGIYTARSSEQNAATDKRRRVADFVANHQGNRAMAVATALARELPSIGDVIECEHPGVEPLAADISWPTGGAILSTQTTATTACIWFTMDMEWILPFNPYLWQHLDRSIASDRRPIIVARKIAFSTFPLLKALGGFGLQLHNLYAAHEPNRDLIDRAFSYFPNTFSASDAEEHPALPKLVTAIAERSAFSATAHAIARAKALGLMDSDAEGPALLRQWANQPTPRLPRPWKAQITRYEKWRSLLRTSSSNPE